VAQAGCAGFSKPPVLPACLAFMVPVAALSGASAAGLSVMCVGGTAVYAYDHR